MPAKPLWYSHLDAIIRELEALPSPLVTRTTVEFLFGVGPRRAQQIMAPCITTRIGANGLIDRDAFVRHLRRLAEGQTAHYERQRRRQVADTLARWQKERRERPQLLVEAPLQVLAQQVDNLPEGVRLEPGCITVRFSQPQEGLQKLLALAMAVANDFAAFERSTAGR